MAQQQGGDSSMGSGGQGNQQSNNQDFAAWGTALGGLLSGIGGFFGGGSEGLSRDDQRFMADFQWKQALRNEEFQNLLARQGIRMKVEDAKAAGLHPLAALGINPSSGSFGTAFSTGQASHEGGLGRGLENLGQNISRASMAMASPMEKQFKQLQLQKMSTENEILNTELQQRRNALMAPGTGQGVPSSNPNLNLGQTDAIQSRVTDIPLRRTFSDADRPWQQAGAIPDYAYARTPDGLAIIPSKDVKESIEDQIIPELSWAIRNYGLATLGILPKPDIKKYRPPPGYDSWRYSIPLQQYVGSKKRRFRIGRRVMEFNY